MKSLTKCATVLAALLALGAALQDCADWYTKGAVRADDPEGFIVDTYNITIVPGSPYSWADILADTVKMINTSHPYVNCIFSAPGGDHPIMDYNCTLKRQGDATRRSPVPSFKIELASGLKWRKQDTFKLKKEPTDFSKLRSKLVGHLMNHTPNTVTFMDSFARGFVTRNGTQYDHGFFTMVEETDSKFLDNRDLPKGSLLKIVDGFNFAAADLTYLLPTTDPNYNEKLFENVLSSCASEKDNRTRIGNTIRAVLNTSISAQQLLNTHFDVPNACTFIAIETLVGNVMNVNGKNYLLYAPNTDDNSARWSFWAWDFDKGLGYFQQPDVMAVVPIPMMVEEGIGTLWANPVFRAIFNTPEYVAVLNATVERMHNTVWNNAYVKSLTDQMLPVIKAGVFGSTDVTSFTGGWGTTAQRSTIIEDTVAMVNSQLDLNYGFFKRSLWQPRPPTLWVSGFNSDKSTHLVTYSEFAHMMGCEVNVEAFVFERPQDAAAMYRPEFPLPAAAAAGAKGPIVNATGLTPNGYNGANGQVEIAMADFYAPNTQYYVRVIHRAIGHPDAQWIAQQGIQVNDPITKLSFKQINPFTTPASFGAAPSISTSTPQPTDAIDGYMYALLDGSASTATGSTCISTLYSLPDGWFIAPNDAITARHVVTLAKTWGTSNLVLRDGATINRATGVVNGGRGLRVVIRKNGIGYAASTCTNRVLLVSANRLVTPACPKYADVQMYGQYLETHDYFADASPDPMAVPGNKCGDNKKNDTSNSTSTTGGSDGTTTGAAGTTTGTPGGTTTGVSTNCGALTAPDHGSVDTTTTAGTALYACEAGFTLVGGRSRVCINGAWSGSAPSCMQNQGCTAPAAPDHGTASVAGAQQTGDSVTFSCEVGYTLSGSATLVCGPTGTYDQSVPTCVASDSSSGPNTVNKVAVNVVSGAFTSAAPSFVIATVIVAVISWMARVQ